LSRARQSAPDVLRDLAFLAAHLEILDPMRRNHSSMMFAVP
jgi:hypothetical protein